MKESDLLNLRKIDCDLEGHPTPVCQESLVQLKPSLEFETIRLTENTFSVH